MNETEEKKKEVVKELGDWFGKPNFQENYYDSRIEAVNNFLEQRTNPKSSSLPFENLDAWHRNTFIYNGLVKGDTSDRYMLATNSYFIVELNSIIAQQFPNNPPFHDLHIVAKFLADVVIQNWNYQANKMLEWILKGLDTKFLKGGQNYRVAGWFIVSVASQAFNKNLETKKYNYPQDMGVYQQVINKWNIQDMAEVNRIVSKLCDYHLEEAYYGDGKNDLSIQFSYTNEFVYAFEILSWLALREMNGLKNPETYSHPLMQLPINQLPTTTTPYKPTELQDKVLARVKEEFNQK